MYCHCLAENISIAESRTTQLQHIRSKMAGATLVWPWYSPETDESARTYQERPPARASESARLGNVIPLPAADSGHLLHRSSCSCLALWAQKPPNSQVSFTLTENKAEGEAACTGDSESQHGEGPYRKQAMVLSQKQTVRISLLTIATHAWGQFGSINVLVSFMSTRYKLKWLGGGTLN